jgi:hypothetical protein
MTNNTNIEKLRRRADNVRDAIEQDVSGSTMDLIDELVELEIEIEKNSNQ